MNLSSVWNRAIRPLVGAAVGLGVLSLAMALPAPAMASSAPAPAAQAPAPAPPVVVGVQDSAINGCDASGSATSNPDFARAASSMVDPNWNGLHVNTARFNQSWDIAFHHDGDVRADRALAVAQACFNYWLAVAAAHHVQPQIAFKPDANFENTHIGPMANRHILVPSISTYRKAMDAFMATYTNCTAFGGTATTCNLPPLPPGFPPYPAGTGGMARVRIISPWNEPNFRSADPIGFDKLPQDFVMPAGGNHFGDANCRGVLTAAACGPVLAAQMWVAVHNRCPGCTVIAGDFSSLGGLETDKGRVSYLDTYARHLSGLRPSVWALHPYSDVREFERVLVGQRGPTPLAGTLVGRFAKALFDLGYHSHTDIWLNEVSSLFIPQNGWTREVQRRAAVYLLDDLTRAGGRTSPGQPVVTRITYFRYADGPQLKLWALVVGGNPVPIYHVFANRPNPH
jgi:hypothetical protein